MKLYNLIRLSLAAALCAGVWGGATARATSTNFSGIYSQNFDTALAGSATGIPAGFRALTLAGSGSTYTAASPITTTAIAGAAVSSSQTLTVWNAYAGTKVASSATKLYNIGCWDSTTDRALGSDPASTVAGMVIELSLTNITGGNLLGVNLSYNCKCLTNGTAGTEQTELPGYSFFYSLTGSTSPGDWVAVPALANGNYTQGTTSGSGPVAIPFAAPLTNHGILYLRWADDKSVANATADQMIGLDDIAITATAPAVSAPAAIVNAPVNNAVIAPGTSIPITAYAGTWAGSITGVAFYAGNTFLGSALNAPYTFTWTSVPVGAYALTVVATNSFGLTVTSPVVNILVDTPPTISLTSPVNNAIYTTPAAIPLTATAAATAGTTLAQVAFYQSGLPVATVANPPYSYTWANPPASSAVNFYGVTAVATDALGLSTTSSVANIVFTNLYALETLQQIKTIFIIPLENHDWVQAAPTGSPEQVSNNPAAPYVNSLIVPNTPAAAQVSFATAYYSSAINGEHPSEPNYVWSEAGTDFGVRTDNDPTSGNNQWSNVQHLSGQLTTAGVSWKTYQEDMQYSSSELVSASGSGKPVNPWNGTTEYSYAVKHNPMAFFTDTQNKNDFPMTNFWTDLTQNNLARYNWITPDQYNEMHSALSGTYTYHGQQFTGDQSAIASGDNFLSQALPIIEASAAYKDHGVIIVWTDETESTDDTNTTLPFFIISPMAKGNAYQSHQAYSHSSDLKTMDEIFGLAWQNNAIPSAELDAQNTGYNYVNGSSAVINDFSDFFVSVTGTTLASSENPSGSKDNVTFTATVAGAGATPTGTVQFSTNGVALGAPVTLINGTATVSTALLPRGTGLVTAVYSGDANNQPNTSSTLSQMVTNHPPVAGPAFYARPAGVPLLVKISDLLNNATDVDGDVISYVGAGSNGYNLLSTNGATLLSNGTYLFYTNSVTPGVNDGFYYTVTDNQGGTSTGLVSLLLTANVPGQSNVKLAVSSASVTASFFGVPGFQYVIQRSTNLISGAGWVPISTNNAPPDGLIQVVDTFQGLGIPIPPVPSPVYYRLQYNP